MYGEKRAKQIEYKARKQRERAVPLFVLINSKTEEGLEMSFLISADEEEQIRQSEEYKQYMEEHKEENDNE